MRSGQLRIDKDSARVDEQKESAEFFWREKNKARTVVGRGEEGPLSDPGSESLLGGSARVVRETT